SRTGHHGTDSPGSESAEGARRVLVVVRPVVRAPEPARRAGGSVRVAALGGRAQVRLRGARDHAGQLRRAAAQGRRDVHARDVRARRERPRGRRVTDMIEGALVRHPTPRATWLRAVALVTLTTFVTTSCGGGGGGTSAHLGSASPISN